LQPKSKLKENDWKITLLFEPLGFLLSEAQPKNALDALVNPPPIWK
jgi:hypothetical protein